MPTVSEPIHSSFRLTGIIAAGETLETAEAKDAFVSLAQQYKASIVQLNASNHMRTPPAAANPLPSQTGVAS
jgi:hypothetical protein